MCSDEQFNYISNLMDDKRELELKLEQLKSEAASLKEYSKYIQEQGE